VLIYILKNAVIMSLGRTATVDPKEAKKKKAQAKRRIRCRVD
jgi:hypothetical protein